MRGPGHSRRLFQATAIFWMTLSGSWRASSADLPPMTVALAAKTCADEPLSTAGMVYYVCDCKPGAAANCQPGRDENTGKNILSPWRSLDKARSAFETLQPGDTLAFCRGGAFEGRDLPWANTHCRANQPCRVRDYRPTWGAAGDHDPKLLHTHLQLDNWGDSQHKEGLRVSNLELDGDGKGFGIFLHNDDKDMSLCNLTVQNYEIGVYVGGANPPGAGSDGLNSRIVLRGSRILHNTGMGWLGSCDGCRIEYNLFDHNGGPNILDHSIYVNGANVKRDAHYTVRGMQVVGNEIYHSDQGTGTVCKGAPIVVHGNQDGLLIQGNTISQDIDAADVSCWGITVNAVNAKLDGFKDVVISRNTVTNVGNASIQLSSCRQCRIENNLIVQAQQGFGARGILVHRNGPRDADNLVGTAAAVLNNTIFFSTTQNNDGITVGSEGRGHLIAGNVIVQAGPGELNCFVYDLGTAAYYSDHNVCWNPNRKVTSWEAHSRTIEAWRQATGLDAHSDFANPEFVRMGWKQYDFSPGKSSPLIGAGDPAHCPTADLLGRRRAAPPDVGALQHR